MLECVENVFIVNKVVIFGEKTSLVTCGCDWLAVWFEICFGSTDMCWVMDWTLVWGFPKLTVE